MSFTLCSENINQAVNLTPIPKKQKKKSGRDAQASLHFISTAVKFVTSLNAASVLVCSSREEEAVLPTLRAQPHVPLASTPLAGPAGSTSAARKPSGSEAGRPSLF